MALKLPETNREVFQDAGNGGYFWSQRFLVTRGESVRTDATAGKKDSKVNYMKLVPIINS